MARKKDCKIVGTISQEIIKEYGLEEYENQEIVQSIDMYIHISKHIREFQPFLLPTTIQKKRVILGLDM